MDHTNRKNKDSRVRGLAILLSLVSGLSVLALGCAGASWGADYDPILDSNSMYNTTLYTGAQAWWNAGYTGKGVDVALIDTGVSPVAGLDSQGKVIDGPDLSLESQAPNLTRLDTYGHGTFMAGLIAGHDADLTAPYSLAATSVYRGMAPDARIVSLKVGTADGGVDVSQVIAAIDWVVQHKNDNGLNIRVINISYGTNSTQDPYVDPLSYAVEQAWANGIVVVAAAGNSGYQVGGGAPGIADPAYNQFVIAAGASDSMGTLPLLDDTVAGFSASARCNHCKRPDIVAPGAHLQGLRVPNSYIDAANPTGSLDDRYFRGSGTSESAAITSGAVALVLQKYPKMTPDQVKAFLKNNAFSLTGTSALAQGSGELNLTAMLVAGPPSKYSQKFHAGSGTGSLEAARGQDHLTRDGVVLKGEQDIFGNPFDSDTMAKLEESASSWSGGDWNGSTWSGNSWSGSSWSGAVWTGNSWSGSSWSASSWSGNSWSGSTWSASSWSGWSWSASSWSGSSWSANSWSSDGWMGASWG
jgi:serine protease AprX